MIDLRPDEAKRLYSIGKRWPITRVAAVCGVTEETVLRWLVARGVVLRDVDRMTMDRIDRQRARNGRLRGEKR